jgi:hypothetical protein
MLVEERKQILAITFVDYAFLSTVDRATSRYAAEQAPCDATP